MKQFRSTQSIVLLLSAVVLIGTAVAALSIGSADIAPGEIAAIVVQRLLPVEIGPELPPVHSKIVWEIRWPRLALAMLIGSSLAVSGACYQALFKNPLADPFILGVSSGAALGAAVAIVLGHTAFVSFYAFAGGAVTIFIVYILGGGDRAELSSNRLLLAGVALGSLLNALLSSIMALHTKQLGPILFWLLGSLGNPPENLTLMAALIAIGLAGIMLFARDLDILATGDENAQFLGVDVAKVKVSLLLCTTLITGTVVAVSGIIGFIGLIVPHMLRKLIGPEHRLLLPACALWGAIFLLWADSVTRLFASLSPVPVGVVTALLGGPFFLYILYRTDRRQ
ncbi:FecCD family ABC transporter permease [Sporolituus thermophilus]|uniref:Iron complex transport system permease protein n=1 Tax=Sporolituus thermophilus DSM 23256 TaxID=1123285 RepID=A0A1G7HJ00_9FIRM|nr:iron ABC transporter permease [Sporolituus thermophilus]SDF00306.1 iron complex transport system permease protein [Sporolituus thermophilus DSM 23256]